MRKLILPVMFLFLSIPFQADEPAVIADEAENAISPEPAVISDDDEEILNPEEAAITGDGEETVTPVPSVIPSGNSIKLVNTGAEGRYYVYVDGELAGADLVEISRLDAGSVEVEIRQIRFGDEKVIFRDRVAVQRGGNQVVSFRIPAVLGSEKTEIRRLKKDIGRALKNEASLFTLETDLNLLLSNLEDVSFSAELENEKQILQDYALKIRIELELRKAVRDFYSGVPVDVSYFQRDLYFHDYKSDITTGAIDYSWALKYVLILKRLEMLLPLIDRDYESYLILRESVALHNELSAAVSPEFSDLYIKDFDYLNALYTVFIDEPGIADRRSFTDYAEAYYGQIWETLDLYKKGRFPLNDREVMALRAAWLGLEPVEGFSREYVEGQAKKLKWNSYILGGALITTGLFWEPIPWFGFQVGISGAYDFIDKSGVGLSAEMINGSSLTVALPVEFDFFIINRKLELYLGVCADLIRFQNQPSLHWSNEWIKTDDTQAGSRIAFITSIGLNLGIGLDLGNVEIFVHNYFHFPDLIPLGFELNSIRFAPAIGVRL